MLVHSFMRGSRNFRQGGGGVQVSLTTFFSPQLILQESNGQFQRHLSFFKVREGVQLFPGGPTFSGGGGGGSNCLLPIETHIPCDFPGGSGPPVPLWIRPCSFKAWYLALLFTYSVSLGFLKRGYDFGRVSLVAVIPWRKKIAKQDILRLTFVTRILIG